jgi:hypothetical protein
VVASGGWSTADTVETIAAVAEVLAAGFTAAMAWMTRRLARETKAMAAGTEALANQTRDMAVATRDMAVETRRVAESSEREATATETLVDEAQQDRSLSWSPYLTRTVIHHVPNAVGNPLGLNEKITLTNLGKGQALRCYYFACEPENTTLWCYATHPGLTGDQSVELVAVAQSGMTPMHLLQMVPHDDGRVDAPFAALFCEDVFGNRIRFLPGRTGREIWRPGEAPVPDWAVAPLLWS